MTNATATATLQAPARSENANPVPTNPSAPVPVTITTVTDLANALAANRLKAAPASPTEPQDAAPAAVPAESHPAEADETAGEADLSQPQQQQQQPESESDEPAAAESEDAAEPTAAETPEQTIERLQRQLAKREKSLAKQQRRIDELTGRVHQSEGKAAPAAAAPPPPAAPEPVAEPLTPSAEVVDLGRRLEALEKLATWMDNDGAGGGTYHDPVFGKDIQVDPEVVESTRKQVEQLRETVAIEQRIAQREARQAWVQEQTALEQAFRDQFPALQKRDAPERAQFEHILGNIPKELRTAGAKLVVAKAMAYDAMQAAKAGKPTPQPRPLKASSSEPTPVFTRPGAAARPTGEGLAELKQAQAAYEKTGSVKDLARMRAAQRALQPR